MPIKRRPAKRRDHRITPEALDAFRQREWLALHRALGLRPWEASPLDATGIQPTGPRCIAETWPKAAALRAEMEAFQPSPKSTGHRIATGEAS